MKKHTINISKYEFHDGNLFKISHANANIELTMESAELLPEEIKEDNLQLSDRNTLRGKLHLENVEMITIDGKLHSEKIFQKYESATILSFEIENNTVQLDIIWQIPFGSTDLQEISISAKIIWWENLPQLANPPCP